MTPISKSPRQIQTCHMNQSIYATTCYHCKSWFTSKLMVNVYRCIQYTMIQYIMLETFRIWCNEVRAFTENLKPIGTLLAYSIKSLQAVAAATGAFSPFCQSFWLNGISAHGTQDTVVPGCCDQAKAQISQREPLDIFGVYIYYIHGWWPDSETWLAGTGVGNHIPGSARVQSTNEISTRKLQQRQDALAIDLTAYHHHTWKLNDKIWQVFKHCTS